MNYRSICKAGVVWLAVPAGNEVKVASSKKKIEPMPVAQTRTESLRLKLEEEILNGSLRPGTKLDEIEVGLRFGLSRTPVREALKSLTASGLVEIRAHQGSYVARPSHRTIEEMVETMAIFEIELARLAARRSNVKDHNAMETAQAECERAVEMSRPAAFYAANVQFHDAIYSAGRNRFLAEQAWALRQRLEPYRRQISYHPGLMRKSALEHRQIINAIISLDETGAAQAMKCHIESLKDTISNLVESIGGAQ